MSVTCKLMALILAIQDQEPAPLPETIPERLRSIALKLLAKDPAARYPSGSAAREALQTALQPAASALVPSQEPDLVPNNLPRQLTSFIGRQKEIAEIELLLSKSRLLTLTGGGGCGKTRLALQLLANVLERFPDGVWLVEMAPLADPALAPQAVAAVLGLKSRLANARSTKDLSPLLVSRATILRPSTSPGKMAVRCRWSEPSNWRWSSGMAARSRSALQITVFNGRPSPGDAGAPQRSGRAPLGRRSYVPSRYQGVPDALARYNPRASANTATRFAPAFFSTRAHSFTVDIVVSTSSTRRTDLPSK